MICAVIIFLFLFFFFLIFFDGVFDRRVYQKFYDKVMAQVNSASWLKRKLFAYAFDSKLAALNSGKDPSPMFEKLVFNKIKEKFGGVIRHSTSGSAPLSEKTADFLRVLSIILCYIVLYVCLLCFVTYFFCFVFCVLCVCFFFVIKCMQQKNVKP